jgi:hypothetical protein
MLFFKDKKHILLVRTRSRYHEYLGYIQRNSFGFICYRRNSFFTSEASDFLS